MIPLFARIKKAILNLLSSRGDKGANVLVCVYTCEQHKGLHRDFYQSSVVKHLNRRFNCKWIEVYGSNSDMTKLEDSNLILATEERYSNLPAKTWHMIEFADKNLDFEFLVKIDSTTLTSTLVNKLPVAGAPLSEIEMDQFVQGDEFLSEYTGLRKVSAARPGAESWAKKKGIQIDYQRLFGDQNLPLFFSGKFWVINRNFATYIANNERSTMELFSQFFPAEDVMIARMHERYRRFKEANND